MTWTMIASQAYHTTSEPDLTNGLLTERAKIPPEKISKIFSRWVRAVLAAPGELHSKHPWFWYEMSNKLMYWRDGQESTYTSECMH